MTGDLPRRCEMYWPIALLKIFRGGMLPIDLGTSSVGQFVVRGMIRGSIVRKRVLLPNVLACRMTGDLVGSLAGWCTSVVGRRDCFRGAVKERTSASGRDTFELPWRCGGVLAHQGRYNVLANRSCMLGSALKASTREPPNALVK